MGWAKYNEDDREICEDRWTMREATQVRKEAQHINPQWKNKLPERTAAFKDCSTWRA